MTNELVNTELLRSLSRVCHDLSTGALGDTCGLIIKGPKGTGKSIVALYLAKILKDAKVPFLVVSPTTYSSTNRIVMNYFRKFESELR